MVPPRRSRETERHRHRIENHPDREGHGPEDEEPPARPLRQVRANQTPVPAARDRECDRRVHRGGEDDPQGADREDICGRVRVRGHRRPGYWEQDHRVKRGHPHEEEQPDEDREQLYEPGRREPRHNRAPRPPLLGTGWHWSLHGTPGGRRSTWALRFLPVALRAIGINRVRGIRRAVHPSKRIHGAKSEKLKGKLVVLAVTGSIAAVETVKLARELIRHGAEVVPVLSKDATEIVHPNALHFATGREAITRIDGSVPYIELVGTDGTADLLLIAPATSNTIAKVAMGIDDTVVTTFAQNALGAGIPIVIAPAMHETMYNNPLIAGHIRTLEKLGVEFVTPKFEEEKAKLADTEEIVERVIRRIGTRELEGKRVVVITGSTAEPIDDVRVVTNRTTGETG
ncbi:MAG: hypothetical protein E6K10_06165, partial [Methanobacteriota archaeon]